MEKKIKWEKKRRRILEEIDIDKKKLKKKREEGEAEISEKTMERIEERGKEERSRKTEESRYNDIYKKIKTDAVPKYLKGKKSKKDRAKLQDIDVAAI